MLFASYGNEDLPSHTPSSSSTPLHPPPPPSRRHLVDILQPSSSPTSDDAVESHLRSLYTRALSHQKSLQPHLASPLFLQLLAHPLHRSLNKGEVKGDTLPRRLLHLHFSALKQLAGLYEETGELLLALQCYGFTSLSSPPIGGGMGDGVVVLKVAMARCAMRVGQLALARGVLEDLWQMVGGVWEVIDALVDCLYCIGDHQALSGLVRLALTMDCRYVKGLLVQSQLQSHPLVPPSSSAFHHQCMAQLQLLPPSLLQSTAQALLDLAASARPPEEVTPTPVVRRVELASVSAVEVTEALLREYREVTGRKRMVNGPASIPTFTSLHRMIRWLKQRPVTEGSSAPAPRTSLASVPSSPSASLTSPFVLLLPSIDAAAVSQMETVLERREEMRRQRRRQRCIRVLRTGLLGAEKRERVAASLEDSSLPSLAAEVIDAEASAPSTSSSFSPPASSAPSTSTVTDFVLENAASDDSNGGVIDVMQRWLRWLRRTKARGLTSELLCQVVLAVREHWSVESSRGGDENEEEAELLFSAAVLLDCLAAASPDGPHPTVIAPVLSDLWARLSLLQLTETWPVSGDDTVVAEPHEEEEVEVHEGQHSGEVERQQLQMREVEEEEEKAEEENSSVAEERMETSAGEGDILASG